MSTYPRIALADRPRFAAKMISVWRWHHLAKGEDLKVTVYPGQWPDGTPHEIKGCPVVEHEAVSNEDVVLILGRIGDVWRAAVNVAFADGLRCTTEELAIATAYMEVDDTRNMKLWMTPDPITGEVPIWTWNR